jgi:small subunit ribosomal protein S6
MRSYETVFIVNDELSEEQRQPLFDKLKGLVSEDQGMLVKFDEWGHKRLAYEIKKHTRGYYVLMEFCGDGALVKEIERNMRLDDRVLKYMTVLKDKAVDVEAVKADIEAAKEQESKPEPTEQAVGEGEDKWDSEPTETVQAPVSETEVPENTPEASDQEEPKNGTRENGAK